MTTEDNNLVVENLPVAKDERNLTTDSTSKKTPKLVSILNRHKDKIRESIDLNKGLPSLSANEKALSSSTDEKLTLSSPSRNNPSLVREKTWSTSFYGIVIAAANNKKNSDRIDLKIKIEEDKKLKKTIFYSSETCRLEETEMKGMEDVIIENNRFWEKKEEEKTKRRGDDKQDDNGHAHRKAGVAVTKQSLFSLPSKDSFFHTIHPDGTKKSLWNIIMALAIFACTTSEAFYVGFGIIPTGGLLGFNILLDAMFWMDIVISFRTAFRDEEDMLETDSRKIAYRYLTRGFAVDLISAFPIYDLTIIFYPSGSSIVRTTPLIRLLRLLKLFRLVRLEFLLQMLKIPEFLKDAIHPSVAKAMGLILKQFLFAHFLACVLYMCVTFADENTFTWADYYGGIRYMSLGIQYQASLYWAFVTLGTVGYGDIVPVNDVERGVLLIGVLMGPVYFGFTVGYIGEIFRNVDVRGGLYEEKLQFVKEFARSRKLSRLLTKILIHHYQYFYKHSSDFDCTHFFDSLSSENAVALQIIQYGAIITKFKFLRESNPLFASRLAALMKPFCVRAGETLFYENDIPQQVYFVQHGYIDLLASVEVRNGFGDVERSLIKVASVGDGDLFGEVLLSDEKSSYTARASEFTELFFVNKVDLMNLLRAWPSVGSMLKEMASSFRGNIERLRSDTEKKACLPDGPLLQTSTHNRLEVDVEESHSHNRMESGSDGNRNGRLQDGPDGRMEAKSGANEVGLGIDHVKSLISDLGTDLETAQERLRFVEASLADETSLTDAAHKEIAVLEERLSVIKKELCTCSCSFQNATIPTEGFHDKASVAVSVSATESASVRGPGELIKEIGIEHENAEGDSTKAYLGITSTGVGDVSSVKSDNSIVFRNSAPRIFQSTDFYMSTRHLMSSTKTSAHPYAVWESDSDDDDRSPTNSDLAYYTSRQLSISSYMSSLSSRKLSNDKNNDHKVQELGEKSRAVQESLVALKQHSAKYKKRHNRLTAAQADPWTMWQAYRIIHPEAYPKVCWDLFIGVFIVYSVLVDSFELAFDLNSEGGFAVMSRILTALFLVDLIISFRTTHVDSYHCLSRNDKEIACRYLRGWFIVDLLSTIPFDVILRSNQTSSGETRVVVFVRFLRLFRLIRLVKVVEVINRITDKLMIAPAIVILFKISMVLFFVCHLVACLWFAIAIAEEPSWLNTYCYNTQLTDVNGTMVGSNEKCAIDLSVSSQYESSMYWAYVTMTTVGFGDIHPTIASTPETVVAILVVLFGTMVTAFVINTLIDALRNMNLAMRKQTDVVESMRAFLWELRVSPGLSRRLASQLSHSIEFHGSLDQNIIFETLPVHLRRQLVHELSFSHCRSLPVIREMEDQCPGIASMVLPRLRHAEYEAGEVMVSSSMCPREVTFVLVGSCECIPKGSAKADRFGRPACPVTIGQGSFFGQDTLFHPLEELLELSVYVKASEATQTATLTLDDWTTLEAVYPTVMAQFKKRLLEDGSVNAEMVLRDGDLET